MAFSSLRALLGSAGSSVIQKGYWGGGYDGTSEVDIIQGLDFISESSINPSVTLSFARTSASTVNSLLRGFWAGGFSGPFVEYNDIDGIAFVTESAIDPSAVLSEAKYNLAGASSYSVNKGYFGGGVANGFVYRNTIDAIRFDTEAMQNPSATLVDTRGHLAAAMSATVGYFAGGWDGVIKNEIDGITFATEAAKNPSAVLARARTEVSGVSSSIRGYFGGGSNNVNIFYTEIDGIRFDTEAAINPSAALSRAKECAGVSSKSKGYWGGGDNNTSPFYYDDLDGMIYSSETEEHLTANLPNKTGFFSGVQAWPQ